MRTATLILLLLAFRLTNAQVITTIAGTGVAGYSGDGGNALQAKLKLPLTICTDNLGNIYFTDFYSTVVRKIDGKGIITTFAGTGVREYSGDGGPATAAGLNTCIGITTDNTGNVYIGEEGRIRKVDAKGIITTIAGGVNQLPGDGGPAIKAALGLINDLEFDNKGNLYCFDDWGKLRKIDTNGIITSIITNTNSAGGGITINKSGEIFFTDITHNLVKKIDTSGTITTVAGNGATGYSGDGGKAISAKLHSPYDVILDDAGNLFIADEWNGAVRKVTPDGLITTIAGTGIRGYLGDGGPATSAQLSDIGRLSIDNHGNLLIADYSNNRIRKVTNAVLPVSMTNFTGELIKNNALLNWQTASEINSRSFNVMRSTDGLHFTSIATVTAAGNSSTYQTYSYIDNAAGVLSSREIYYRLQEVDKDGSIKYSKTIRLSPQHAFELKVSPNPVKDILYINIKGDGEKAQLTITDIMGHILYMTTSKASNNYITCSIANFARGAYVLSVVKNGQLFTQKFIKE